MRVVLFCHSLLSDWNHGHAHFLRGVVTELSKRGADIQVYEPENAWSMENLLAERGGEETLEALRLVYRRVRPHRYTLETLDLGAVLDGADLVIVHEWNEPELVYRVGQARARGGRFKLLFHDTHHRSVTAPGEMARYDLSHYDGVLAVGDVIRRVYLERGWARHAWTWHEAADVRVFRPEFAYEYERDQDLVWVGNWGDEEHGAELHEFLLGPVKRLGLKARVHGVRYPQAARTALAEAGISYGGWLPNHEVPRTFARALMTVHVPRRPYSSALPGLPTPRTFEALACGIPLVCAPWEDAEHLFTPGLDFLVARDGEQMERHLAALREDADLRRALAEHGRRTILARHTCAHRVEELLGFCRELGVETGSLGSVVQERVTA
jgi:spore maturation protein CgeB